ncbi:hypothetical protein ACN47E_007710 [Coniothyrium glycines]
MKSLSSKLRLLITLLLLCTSTAYYDARPQASGIAFRLTPTHGIAAIHLKDGTSIPVARIHGSSAYQSFMRNNIFPTPDTSSTKYDHPSQAFTPFPSSLTRYPPINQTVDIAATKVLLTALKTSVEAYLGDTICYAALSLDYRTDCTFHGPNEEVLYTASIVQTALESLGISQLPRLHIFHAGRAEVRALLPAPQYENGAVWLGEKPEVILAVDYNSGWFNVGLYERDEGILDVVRDAAGNPVVGKHDQLGALKAAMEQLLSAEDLPQGVGTGWIDHLVISGEDARNRATHDVLGRISGAQMVSKAYVARSGYESVGEVALAAYQISNDIYCPQSNTATAATCRRGSALYPDEPSWVYTTLKAWSCVVAKWYSYLDSMLDPY